MGRLKELKTDVDKLESKLSMNITTLLGQIRRFNKKLVTIGKTDNSIHFDFDSTGMYLYVYKTPNNMYDVVTFRHDGFTKNIFTLNKKIKEFDGVLSQVARRIKEVEKLNNK